MIDWERVRELRGEIGEESFDEVVTLFLEEVQETLERLCPESPRYAADMHFLKGSALNIGFSEMASACHREEARAGPGSREAISQVRALFAASREAFLSPRGALMQAMQRAQAEGRLPVPG